MPRRQVGWQRVGVLVDLESLERVAQEEFDGYLSASGLLEQAAGGRQVPRAQAYFEASKRSRAEALRAAGFDSVVPIESRTQRLVQLVVDALALAGRVDSLVIATADPSLMPLLEAVRALGTRVELACFQSKLGGFQDLERRGIGVISLGREAIFVP